MDSLPLSIYSAQQLRALDQRATATLGVPSFELMRRAGAAALTVLRKRWPDARRIVIACGPGNNGGDGYVLARLARAAGFDVVATSISDIARTEGDARAALTDFTGAGGEVHPWSAQRLDGADVIVDALFGIGLSRPIQGAGADCIRAINRAAAPVLALDIPSGLHADNGAVLDEAVVADATLAFIGLKLGFYVGAGQDHAGCIQYDALGAPTSVCDAMAPTAVRISEREVPLAFPPRSRISHKGANGRVLVIGGGREMGGAARLAGEAALRVGAGLVTVASHPGNVAAIVSARPELICRGIERSDELSALIDQADVLALGPGLGKDDWAQRVFASAIDSTKPMVVDADALNLLALHPRSHAHWILTPHPGEAGRLLGWTSAQIQADRLGAARALVERYGGVTVLKGAGTIIATRDSAPTICDRGNPGMASAGMGDVLTGVIAGTIAQGATPATAARIGVLVHAMAGDRAAHRGERGLLASDLFEHIAACVNPT